MKVPKTFLPEQSLEKKVEKMLQPSKKHTLDRSATLITDLEIESDLGLLTTFDGSLRRLKEKKYTRHLRPWEYFGMLISYYEGNLPEQLHFTAQQMLGDYGEWFSMAWKRKGDKLICYTDPENLNYDKVHGQYEINKKLNYRLEKEFNIKKVPSKMWVHVTKFTDDFIDYFYNKQLEDMPEYVIMAKNHFLIYLPEEDVLAPVSRSFGTYSMFSMGCFNKISNSMGVKARKR